MKLLRRVTRRLQKVVSPRRCNEPPRPKTVEVCVDETGREFSDFYRKDSYNEFIIEAQMMRKYTPYGQLIRLMSARSDSSV
mmetsp:Transcript_3253/g.9937  ORF Transcript_3253/g.9937 Transcript_3253/m.9937 type:complete len:81 (+) Transcript_3253:282-524(+)